MGNASFCIPNGLPKSKQQTSGLEGANMLYQILERMIARGNTVGLQDKLDVFYAVGRLTETEYQVLTGRLTEGNE